jgi:hypothetical protein
MARTTSTRTSSSRSTAARKTTARKTTNRSRSSSSSSARKSTPAKQATSARRQAASKASDAQDQASSTLRSQLDERSNQAGEQLATTASDVRQIAGQLRTQDNDGAARIADMAADRIDQVASYLSGASGDALLSDMEDFARSRPMVAAGAAAVLGFAASRALSSSRRVRHGGEYVHLDAGSDFDEEDAASVYPSGSSSRSGSSRSRS